MAPDKDTQGLRDLDDKLRSAREAAERDDAGEREKADLRLLEQEAMAEKLRAERDSKRPSHAQGGKTDNVDAKLDKALKDSFPGSDPVSFVQAAPLTEDDAALSTVPTEKAKAAKKH